MDQWKDWGYVYIVRSGSRYKIGYTAGSVQQRLSTLQIGSPGRIVLVCSIPSPDPKRLERDLQTLFQERHTRGEWYALTGKDVKVLKAEAQSAAKTYALWQLQRSAERAANHGWL